MTVCSTNAPGIKQVQHGRGGGQRPAVLSQRNKMDVMFLSWSFPLINQSSTKRAWRSLVGGCQMANGRIGIKLRLNPDPDKVIKAVREQLGLELTSTNRTLEILEITKAKN